MSDYCCAESPFCSHVFPENDMIDMDGHFVQLEEPHQPSLEELEDIFTSPDILKDCN